MRICAYSFYYVKGRLSFTCTYHILYNSRTYSCC